MKLPAAYIQGLIDGAAAAGYDRFTLGANSERVDIMAFSDGRGVCSVITGEHLALTRMGYEAVKEGYRASLEQVLFSSPPPLA